MLAAPSFPSRLLSLALFLGFVGCVSFLHPGSVERSVDGSYEQVFASTLEVLEAQGFSFERIDRENGRIVTDRRPTQMGTTGRRVEKANAHIEADDGTADVRLLLTFTDQVSERPPRIRDRNDNGRADDVADAALSRSFSASAVYDDYLDAIEERVEEHAGADGP